jgi:hypothetical protein
MYALTLPQRVESLWKPIGKHMYSSLRRRYKLSLSGFVCESAEWSWILVCGGGSVTVYL